MLTQIRNIRKTILPTQMPLTILFSRRVYLFLPWSAHMSPSLLRSPSPLYTSQPGSQIETLEMITTPSQGATLTPSWWWCRYLAINRWCLHPAQYCSKSSKIIMRTLRHAFPQFENDKTAISYPKPGVSQKPVVPVPDDLHHHHEALQICSNWCLSIVFFVHF